mmetsp:Transcript_42483/g.74502  ORF Transcript_42483/g.74502 Transcript_42483/m.74502 type:complete len:612 (+) Transcript_42483:42-1877(+)
MQEGWSRRHGSSSTLRISGAATLPACRLDGSAHHAQLASAALVGSLRPRDRDRHARALAKSSKRNSSLLLPPIEGLPGASAGESSGSKAGSSCCSLASSDSSDVLAAEAAAAAVLSPNSLRKKLLAVERDNRRLRKALGRQEHLKAGRCEACAASHSGSSKGKVFEWSSESQSDASQAPNWHFVFLYASPLCLMQEDGCAKLLPRLEAENEAENVRMAFGAHGAAVENEVLSVRSLYDAACRSGAWLHVCAHGVKFPTGQWALLVEDQGVSPVAQKFAEEDLESVLATVGSSCAEFIFLAVCNSNVYREAFRRAGFQHIIDCESKVQDKEAAVFARDLYKAMADGQHLRGAFDVACAFAKARGASAAWHLEGDGRLWLPKAPCIDIPDVDTITRPVTPLPREPEDFVGRTREMCEVLMALERRSIVVLHSNASNGRTATLWQIGQYANRRGRHFANRVAFYPDSAVAGGLWIVDDADEALSDARRDVLLNHLASHRGSRLLLACREACYNAFLDQGLKPYNVLLPPLEDPEATDLFLRSTCRPLTTADISPSKALDDIGEDACRIVPKVAAQHCVQNGISIFGGEPGKVRKAGSLVRPDSPPLQGELPKIG